MVRKKLDKKDMKILDVLDREPNTTLHQLAKQIGISRQVAEYRLKKMMAQKTIYNFYTFVDVGMLGFSSFRVHIRLKNVTREAYTKFAQYLFRCYPTQWVAFVSGSFDLIVDIFAKNPNTFESILAEIVQEKKDIIQSYETLIMLNLSVYQYNYFTQQHSTRRKITFNQNGGDLTLDEKDRHILSLMKLDSRLPYEAIGREVDLSRNAVKHRIQQLEKSGVIKGYAMLVDFTHMNKQSFKIFVKYDTQKREQETDLLHYLRQTPGILATLQLFGRWDLDIEIHKESITELQEFIMELRDKFPIIEDYEIVHIIEDYGIDFFPEKLPLE